MRAAQGAASSAQATDRSLPGRPESSFPPLGLLSPPNPLRWASAGAPITASANGAGGDADPVFASSVQPTAAMSPRFGGAPGAHPRPFLSHRFLTERKRCARRVGGAGGASDKNPAKPPSKKRRAPGASRQADGAPGRRAPHRRPKLRIVRFRVNAKAHSLRWASSPHRTRFAGLRRGPHWAGGYYPPLQAWQLADRRRAFTPHHKVPYIWSVSNRMVTGPSFWLYTCMSAPNSPCSTRKPRAVHSAMNFS